jgi:hypothetical protein
MKPSEMETGGEFGFSCESCKRTKDDVFILPDGSVVCADCTDFFEHDRTKQN